VFGAGGFLGRSLCEGLLAHGVPVLAVGPGIDLRHVNLERIDNRLDQPGRFIPFLSPRDILFDAIGLGTPSTLVSYSSKGVADELQAHAVLVDAALGAKTQKLVLLSSGGTVYGRRDADAKPWREGEAVAPLSPYGLVKVQIEEMVKAAARAGGLESVICRLSNPYGPGQINRRAQGLVATVFAKLLDGEPIRIWGNGDAVRDYIYIDDARDGVLAASQLASGAIVHVSSGVGRTTRQVVEDVAATLGVEPNIEWENTAAAGVSYNVLSNELLFSTSGWAPKMSWREGLMNTGRWWLDRARREESSS
jgi:UDP-glucose 4-epimerase